MSNALADVSALTSVTSVAVRWGAEDLSKSSFDIVKNMDKAAKLLATLKEPQYEGMIEELEAILKYSEKLSKIDEVKSADRVDQPINWAGVYAQRMLPKIRKLEKEYKRSPEAKGLAEADITLKCENWDGQSLDKNIIEISIRADKYRETTFTKKISGGKVRFRGLMIPRRGYVNVKVRPIAKKLKTSEKGIDYSLRGRELKLSGKLINPMKMPIEAEGIKQISSKIGDSAEIGLGIEYGPISLDGKKVKLQEVQKMKSTRVKMSWVLKVPSGGLDLSAQ